MKKKKFYTITNDVIFKLSLQNNLEALHKICTIFIKDLKDDVYNPNEIRLEKTDFPSLEIKSSILDVKFQIVNKYSFDLEMQKYRPSYSLEDRIVKYHAELIIRSYQKGEDYNHLSCHSLWFLDFNNYNDDIPIHSLISDELKNSAGSITIVEINKLKNYNKDNIWYRLFTEDDYSKLKGEDRIMDELINNIEQLNDDDSLAYLMSERYRGIIEQNALRNGDREQGLKEGREQGRIEALKEIAYSLKKDGMPIEKIVEYTGLTIEEIESL